ncbi:hypothetical protein V8G54_015646 [Vigna mungo]|uniref:N-acetyltransferase domain-containing protein n=1 Tax=Vigna mungo TaxID=3915 RepID=A0AAQ3S0D2_VIGMU
MELGYVIGSKYWGKGVATVVVKEVVKVAFSEQSLPNLERIEALVDVLNVGSQRVLEKAGFQREGILRKYCKIQNPMEKSEEKEESVDLSRISLRPLELSDLDDVLVWTSDEKVATFCTWDPYSSKEEGINFIQNIASKLAWCRAICLNDRAIGCVSLSSKSEHDQSRSLELGYVIGSKYWGKGVATVVVKEVVEVAFTEQLLPNLERIEALVDVLNVGSQRVLEKAGFQREGILRKYVFLKGKARDMVMFSVLSTDPHLSST